jgi:hypothetical protein
MIKRLLFYGISTFAIFQAQAMVDTDDDGTSKSTSLSLSTLPTRPGSNQDEVGRAASLLAPRDASMANSLQDATQVFREQNTVLQEQSDGHEVRFSEQEALLSTLQIGPPQHVRHVTDPLLSTSQAEEEDDLTDLVDADTGLPYNPDDFSYPPDQGSCQK